jgi:hypothetical protein
MSVNQLSAIAKHGKGSIIMSAECGYRAQMYAIKFNIINSEIKAIQVCAVTYDVKFD